MSCLTEYNENETEKFIRQEERDLGRAEGRTEGEISRAYKIYKNLINKGMTPNEAEEITMITPEQIAEFEQENELVSV